MLWAALVILVVTVIIMRRVKVGVVRTTLRFDVVPSLRHLAGFASRASLFQHRYSAS